MHCALLTGLLVLSLPLALQARQAKPYSPPHNALGQPDLSGFWTNATLTPTSRAADLGDRAIYTPDEVRKIEGDLQAGIEKGNQKVDNTQRDGNFRQLRPGLVRSGQFGHARSRRAAHLDHHYA